MNIAGGDARPTTVESYYSICDWNCNQNVFRATVSLYPFLR